MNDSGTVVERSAQPDVTTSHRLLGIGVNGATLNGEIGNTAETMGALTWGGTTTAPGLCTFDLATFGCNRDAANPDGATGWSGWMRRFTVWSEEPPADELDEWNETVTL